MDDGGEPGYRRGTALLIISVIFVAAFAAIVIIPRTPDLPELQVRVCVIDSGINKDYSLDTRVVLEKSFINTSYGYSVNLNSTTDSHWRCNSGCSAGLDDRVGQALMVSFPVIVYKVSRNRASNRVLTKEDHPIQAFGLRCVILMPFQNASVFISPRISFLNCSMVSGSSGNR